MWLWQAKQVTRVIIVIKKKRKKKKNDSFLAPLCLSNEGAHLSVRSYFSTTRVHIQFVIFVVCSVDKGRSVSKPIMYAREHVRLAPAQMLATPISILRRLAWNPISYDVDGT